MPKSFRRQMRSSGCDLRGLDLRGLEADGLDFSDCYFRQSDLRGVDLSNAKMEGASINACKISGVLFPLELSASEIELAFAWDANAVQCEIVDTPIDLSTLFVN